MEDKKGQLNLVAAEALGEIGPAAVPELRRLLRDGNSIIKMLAADALGGIGAPAVPVLIEALADQHGVVRGRAAIALTQIGPAAKDAIPALEKMLNDEASFPRQMAAEAHRVGAECRGLVIGILLNFSTKSAASRILAADWL